MGMREQVTALRQKNPCLTLQQIGNKVHLTRQRVQQILAGEGLPTAAYRRDRRFVCRCGKTIEPTIYKSGNRYYSQYCSKRCRFEAFNVPLACSSCGQISWRKQSQMLHYDKPYAHRLRQKTYVFCSRKCQGKYLGEHFGFAAHPENSGGHNSLGKSKYNLGQISAQRQPNESTWALLCRLGIPGGSSNMLLKRWRVHEASGGQRESQV